MDEYQILAYLVVFLNLIRNHCAYHKFKMITVESSFKLMSKGYYMASIYLRDAYYWGYTYCRWVQKYLKFIWRVRMFQFTEIRIGILSSPGIFTNALAQSLLR